MRKLLLLSLFLLVYNFLSLGACVQVLIILLRVLPAIEVTYGFVIPLYIVGHLIAIGIIYLMIKIGRKIK